MEQEPNPPKSAALPVLRREVVVLRERPGRAGVWLAACMFAGIFAGFSVKTIAISGPSHRRAVAAAPQRASGSCVDGCAWLGIAMVSHAGQVIVTEVYPDTPAAAAGMLPGDRLVRVTGQRVARASQVVHLVRENSPGEIVTLDVWRPDSVGDASGHRHRFTVELSEIDSAGLRDLQFQRRPIRADGSR